MAAEGGRLGRRAAVLTLCDLNDRTYAVIAEQYYRAEGLWLEW